MALAIKFQEMVDRGEVRDYADLSRLGHVTRARMSQIMNLLMLAPDIQEELLFLQERPNGSGTTEHEIRQVATAVAWSDQRKRWSPLRDAGGDQTPL